MLQQYSLAFSIETKRYGGNAAKGEQQMGIWHAAQWEFLITRAGAEAVAKLDFLPGIVIQGYTWPLVITMRNQGITVRLMRALRELLLNLSRPCFAVLSL
jgi:hypothetical protein